MTPDLRAADWHLLPELSLPPALLLELTDAGCEIAFRKFDLTLSQVSPASVEIEPSQTRARPGLAEVFDGFREEMLRFGRPPLLFDLAFSGKGLGPGSLRNVRI